MLRRCQIYATLSITVDGATNSSVRLSLRIWFLREFSMAVFLSGWLIDQYMSLRLLIL